MHSALRTAAIATFAALTLSSANAAVVTFSDPNDLANNFRNLNATQGSTVVGGVLNVAKTASSAAHTMVFDTTPGESLQRNTFSASTSPVSVSFDLGNLTNADSSIGVYFIVPDVTPNDGETQYWSYLALLNVDSTGGNDRIRFGQWAQASTGSAGTLVTASSATDLGIDLSTTGLTTVTASYKLETNGDVTVSMMTGANTFSQTYTGGIARAPSVEVGLRFFPTGGSYDVDNITIVPEPASLALLGLAGLALIRRRRA